MYVCTYVCIREGSIGGGGGGAGGARPQLNSLPNKKSCKVIVVMSEKRLINNPPTHTH